MGQEGADEFPHHYYTGNGQFYNTQMVRSLSEVGQTGTSGPGGGPAGNAIAPPSGGGDGSFGHWYVNNVLDPSSTGNQLGNLPDIGFSSEAGSFVIPLGTIAQIIEEWVSFFEWLFGGGGTPVIPRQLLHNRHPLYDAILGVPHSVIVDMKSTPKGSDTLHSNSGRARPAPVELVQEIVPYLDPPAPRRRNFLPSLSAVTPSHTGTLLRCRRTSSIVGKYVQRHAECAA
jgi:hypothetical protein